MGKTYCANLAVMADSQEEILRAVETLSRQMVGLSLDGLTANLTCVVVEEETQAD